MEQQTSDCKILSEYNTVDFINCRNNCIFICFCLIIWGNAHSRDAQRRKAPETWCKRNGTIRLCGFPCTKSAVAQPKKEMSPRLISFFFCISYFSRSKRFCTAFRALTSSPSQ